MGDHIYVFWIPKSECKQEYSNKKGKKDEGKTANEIQKVIVCC